MVEIKKRFFCVSISLLAIFFFLYFPGLSGYAEEKVSVLSFGADTEGITDQTDFIQNAIDYQSSQGGGIVFFPKGTYLIDAVKSIVLRNNITLEFEETAVIKAIPNNSGSFQMIRIHDIENANIIGKVKIQGERQEHTGTLGEWGMGISIKGSKNIKIENVTVTDNWGDGIYIGSTTRQNFSQDIQIINPVADNNRRQGISVISVKNLEIINAVITNTNGTMPQGGIDFEPNNELEFLENIRVINLSTENNSGSGLLIYPGKLNGIEESNHISIYVDSTKNIKDGYAVKGIEKLHGEINVGGYYYLSNKEIIQKPLVNLVTNTATSLTGTAPTDSTVHVKVGTKVIGSNKTASNGEYTVTIPKQIIGTTLSVTATDAAGNESEETTVTVIAENFTDVEFSNWFYKEVVYLSEKNIVQGFPNGNFYPYKNTTRAEAAKMLATALSIPTSNKKTEYSDLKDGHWAISYISATTSAGIFNGYTDGSFKPNNNITRAEMAKILALSYNLEGPKHQIFKDVPSNHWASNSISGIFQEGLTYGYPDNTFRPEEATSRAEFSVFLSRALDSKFR